MSDALSYRAFVMAMDRVERRLRTVTAALDGAGIRYAVIGGNAVALWVAKADPAATRTTKDVDLLVDRQDLDRITEVMRGLGYFRLDSGRFVFFIDPSEPSPTSRVRLVWAGEKVRPSYDHASPTLDEAVCDGDGFCVLGLAALLRMKLTSMRTIDRVHVADLLRVGLIDDEVRANLSADLRLELGMIEQAIEFEFLHG